MPKYVLGLWAALWCVASVHAQLPTITAVEEIPIQLPPGAIPQVAAVVDVESADGVVLTITFDEDTDEYVFAVTDSTGFLHATTRINGAMPSPTSDGPALVIVRTTEADDIIDASGLVHCSSIIRSYAGDDTVDTNDQTMISGIRSAVFAGEGHDKVTSHMGTGTGIGRFICLGGTGNDIIKGSSHINSIPAPYAAGSQVDEIILGQGGRDEIFINDGIVWGGTDHDRITVYPDSSLGSFIAGDNGYSFHGLLMQLDLDDDGFVDRPPRFSPVHNSTYTNSYLINQDLRVGRYTGSKIVFDLVHDDDTNGVAGNDLIKGAQGRDFIIGEGGVDTIFGDATFGAIQPNAGANTGDIIDGGYNRDYIIGSNAGDGLYGGVGGGDFSGSVILGDFVFAYDGPDKVSSGSSVFPTMADGNESDTLNGGPDEDTAVFDATDDVSDVE